MIDHTLDAAQSILYVRPKAALQKADFEQLVAEKLASHFVAATIKRFPAGVVGAGMLLVGAKKRA
jgi:hypothetical protein